jgi:hypothetical protein
MKIRELSQQSIDEILRFWESTNQEDKECNCWLEICGAASLGDGILKSKYVDYLFGLKYQLGIKILKRIRSNKHD